MEKRERIYEGKAKIVYNTDDPDLIIQYFKDETTAFNAAKRGTVMNKGIINNKISARVFQFLSSEGIPTHYVQNLGSREMLIKRAAIIPVEVVVRNKAAGSICRVLGLEEGRKLVPPIIEFCYKRDDLNDPLINEYHIKALDLVSDKDMEIIKQYTIKINGLMSRFFALSNLELIDFKLEFGKYKNEIILADEISPDTCRLWEIGTGEKYDKDRFRHDMGDIEESYQEVLSRVEK